MRDLYVPTTERSPLGSVIGIGAAFFPPGVQIPGAQGLDVFDHLMEQLQPMGLYTPWATRVGSMDWTVVQQPPDTNIVVGALDDSLYKQVLGMGFGAPLPFVVVHTTKLPSAEQIRDAVVGTAYEFYETQAVYGQRDASDPPKITFLHWLSLRKPEDSQGGAGSLTGAAQKIGGQLGAAMQVGYTDTKMRPVPTEAFEVAFASQFGVGDGGGGGQTLPAIPEDDGGGEAEGKALGLSTYQIGVAAVIALACGAAGYVAYQAIAGQPPKRKIVRRRSTSRAIVRRGG